MIDGIWQEDRNEKQLHGGLVISQARLSSLRNPPPIDQVYPNPFSADDYGAIL